jgi:hypothetical protein
MPLLDQAICSAEWAAALDDADLDLSQCKLSVLPAVRGDARSVHYPPGRELGADRVINETLAAELNRPENRDHHRVAVLGEASDDERGRAVFAALLRHELEHARQWEAWRAVPVELSCLFDDVIDVLVGEHIEAGRQLYRAQPNERDANAAASRFVRRRYHHDVIDDILASEDYVLVATVSPPEPLESLPMRNVAFLFQNHDVCRQIAERVGESFAARLERIAPAVRAAWEDLEHQLKGWA